MTRSFTSAQALRKAPFRVPIKFMDSEGLSDHQISELKDVAHRIVEIKRLILSHTLPEWIIF
jgi:hypothetical protein